MKISLTFIGKLFLWLFKGKKEDRIVCIPRKDFDLWVLVVKRHLGIQLTTEELCYFQKQTTRLLAQIERPAHDPQILRLIFNLGGKLSDEEEKVLKAANQDLALEETVIIHREVQITESRHKKAASVALSA